jgi:hypothetical protein
MEKQSEQFNPLISWICSRIRKNKNAIMCIIGPTGSSKTYDALEIGRLVSLRFNSNFKAKENIAFYHADFIRNTRLEQNTKKGTPFIFEEVGSAVSGSAASKWQSNNNALFNSFCQTARHRNQVLIFTTPDFSFIDAKTRKLIHIVMETQYIDYIERKAYVKPFLLQLNARTGKIYFKYLRFRLSGVWYVVKTLPIDHPPFDLVKEYEEMKKQYSDKLENHILMQSEKDERKKDQNIESQINISKYDLLKTYLDKGYTQISIAKAFNISQSAVSQMIKRYKMQKNTVIPLEKRTFEVII